MYPEWSREDIHSPSVPHTTSSRRSTSQVSPAKHMPSSPPHTSQHTLLLLYETPRRSPTSRGPSRENHAPLKYPPRSSRPPRQGVDRSLEGLVQDCCCSCGSSRQGQSRVQIMPDMEDRLVGLEARPCAEPSVRRPAEVPLAPSRKSGLHKPPSGSPPKARVKPLGRLSAICMAPSGRSLLMSLALCLLLAGGTEGSEFPDRECCDSVPPPPPNYHQATSTTTTTTPTPHAGHNTSTISVGHAASGVVNCIKAQQQCYNDPSCRDVLIMLHKICGPELVACATVTPGKCKLLLKTLGTFNYLTTCSCAEPHIDFSCYTFRETIFNHPCSLVDTPDEATALVPTCNEAIEKCKVKASCLRDYMEFVNVCSFNGITCTAQESEKCDESWRKIRLSPLFGCVCSPRPNILAYGDRNGPSRLSTYGMGISGDDQGDCMLHYNKTHANPCLAGQKDVTKGSQVEMAQAMCHVALDQCQNDEECRPLLDGVMVWCEHTHCEPDRCRSALQEFYERVSIVRRLQVAFCVCRQSDPDGECLTAMRKLHPTCAERHSGRDPMKCHKIAEHCRQNPVCRKKLQEYEQKCAADAMTGRCSDTHRNCQQAVMNILGTELHATCVCKGTDFLHQHDCYTWQKLLWSNPCVIESHLKLQEEINSGATEELDEVFRSMTPAQTTPTPRTPFVQHTPDPDYLHPPGGVYGSIRYTPQEPDLMRPGSSETYGIDRSSIWSTRRQPGITLNNRGREGSVRRTFSRNGGNNNILVYSSEGKPKGDRFLNRGSGIGRERNGLRKGGGLLESSVPNEWSARNRPTSLTAAGPDRTDVDAYGPDQGVGRQWFRGHVETLGHRGTAITLREPGPDGEMVPGRDHSGGPRIGWPGGEGWSHGRGGTYHQPDLSEEDIVEPEGQQPPYGHKTPPIYVAVTPTPPPPPTSVAFITTTTSLATTTTPQRSCFIKDGDMMTLNIPEGSAKRLYKDSDCSELCHCKAVNRGKEPEASCITLTCIDSKSCNTTQALYPHAAPYYLAYRGECICYSGNFICQKPNPDSYYTLPPGIYLFLGYSRGEMEILRPHTETNELEAVQVLEAVLIRDYGFKCTLTTKHHIGENFIIIAQLAVNPETYISPFVKQRREKEECAGPLQKLVDKINSRPRHGDILTDAILSMFILADVEVNIPEAQTSLSAAPAPAHRLADPVTLLAVLFAHLMIITQLVAVAAARPT
ncbi:uncharacterized protein [Panulirus ornatus]|uniref:uncharacterized protein isoform X2 n=1 Tax=Panulirus ornatus TaxID=150431 RepID=UPI003A86243E